MRNILIVVTACILFSCNDQSKETSAALPANDSLFNQVQTGGIKVFAIETPKGKFNIWTKSIGNNPKIKLLLLNGGPGATHEYFECFESFFPQQNIEFIYYDQLGCGLSDPEGSPGA